MGFIDCKPDSNDCSVQLCDDTLMTLGTVHNSHETHFAYVHEFCCFIFVVKCLRLFVLRLCK